MESRLRHQLRIVQAESHVLRSHKFPRNVPVIIFVDLVAAGKVAVYLDDILIYSTDLENHRKVVHEVLHRLQEHDLFLQPEKCEFEQTSVEYLGLVISEGTVHMDEVKVKAIAKWLAPKNLRKLQGFLEFANLSKTSPELHVP